jgi:hypothetical protein
LQQQERTEGNDRFLRNCPDFRLKMPKKKLAHSTRQHVASIIATKLILWIHKALHWCRNGIKEHAIKNDHGRYVIWMFLMAVLNVLFSCFGGIALRLHD